jgi:peptide deformylase
MDARKRDLRIVRYGHPALRRKSAPVGRVSEELRALAEEMAETMRTANGVGLAANQVGVNQRLAVVEVEGKLIVLIDPEITSRKGEQISDEGCLSLPRLFGEVARPAEVVVRARDLNGKWFKIRGEGLLARALSHEIDHLNGHLFTDRVDEDTLHWLIRSSDGGEPVVQPTTVAEALKVFASAAPEAPPDEEGE